MKKSTLFLMFFWVVNSIYCQVNTYDVPDGEELRSPDYEVSVEYNGISYPSFTYYSFGDAPYNRYKWDGITVAEVWDREHIGPTRNSYSIFSFEGSVTVRVKLLENAYGISLPLKSAKILPSSYNITCTVENGNTIVFELDKPRKVVVLPNYDEAWDIYVQKGVGHKPISSWKANYAVEKNYDTYHGKGLSNSLTEGYVNPLFVFAHGPEKRKPKQESDKTLFVAPSDNITQSLLDGYDTVCFTPGIYDLSEIHELPWQHTFIRKGQTFYLEGGAYVQARIMSEKDGNGVSSVVGRGIISGLEHRWVRSSEYGSQIMHVDSIIGITVTDRAGFGIYEGRYIGDMAIIGAWHGNTDAMDYIDNCLIEDCFLLAHDDNLKLNDNSHFKNGVIWQAPNAHAIMVKEISRDGTHFYGSTVEDVDVITYLPGSDWDNPWPQVSAGVIGCVTAMEDFSINNFTFKNIRVESPYIYRLLSVYNLNTNLINPGWFIQTTDVEHTYIYGMRFENITVNSPIICYRSLIGSDYENSLYDIELNDIQINGVLVDDSNIDEYFEIDYEKINGFRLNHASISQRGKEKISPISFYPNPVRNTLYINKPISSQVVIYNTMGKLMLVSKSDAIDVSKLIPGVYIIRIAEPEVYTGKFIKD